MERPPRQAWEGKWCDGECMAGNEGPGEAVAEKCAGEEDSNGMQVGVGCRQEGQERNNKEGVQQEEGRESDGRERGDGGAHHMGT